MKTCDTNKQQETSHLNSLSIKNFRNYKTLELSGLGRFNVLIGPNAKGKTNAIEAIQLVTELSSFRHPHIADLFPFNKTEKIINDEKEDSLDSLDEYIKIVAKFSDRNEIKLIIDNEKKQYFFNEKKKSITDIKGLYPAVVFNPDDLMLVKGGNSLRRRAIDGLGSQVSKNYYTVRKDYSRILKQKNMLLKEGTDTATLNAINEVMALPAAQLTCYRANLCNKLQSILSQYYSQIAGTDEELTIRYCPSIPVEIDINDKNIRNKVTDMFNEQITQICDAERCSNKTLFGPHKDKILFEINKRPAEKFASQGQQRSIVLAFKLAEVELINEKLHTMPILLLDDVMSELDENRRRSLLDFSANNMQVFITTTNLNYFDKSFLEKANVIYI